MKKFLSLFFCVMLLFTLLSTSVLAADTCTFTLVVEPAEGGTMSDDYGLITTSSKQYQKDSLVNFNAAANKGYHLAGWKKDGKFLGAPYSYAFTTDKDYTITAVLKNAVSNINPMLTVTGNNVVVVLKKAPQKSILPKKQMKDLQQKQAQVIPAIPFAPFAAI